jgi:hypothetical protein
MPRKRPSALRVTDAVLPADRLVGPGRTRDFSRIKGLSARTSEAVQRLEAERFWPGYVLYSLTAYSRFLRQPGRFLSLGPREVCSCCDPVWARDELQEALDALPPGARDLRRIVARLDRRFERRTLPDPRPPRDGESTAWWHYRIYDH